MKRTLPCGVAIAALWTTAGLAQQQTGLNLSNYVSQPAINAAARQAAEQRARDEARYQAYLQRMTPEARAEFEEFVQRQSEQLMANPNFEEMGRSIRRSTDIYLANIESPAFDTDAFNPAVAAQLTDRQFGESAASGFVKVEAASLNALRNQFQNLRPLIKDLAERNAAIAREAERLLLQSNPDMTPRERDQLRYDTFRAENAARFIDTRLDELEYRLQVQEARLREAEGRIAAILTQQVAVQGYDLRQWDLPTQPPPASQPSLPPTTAPPASPAPSPSPPSATTARQDPAPPEDPYAALRLPSPPAVGSGRTTPARPGRIIQLPDGTYTQEFPQDPALQANATPAHSTAPTSRPPPTPTPQPSPAPQPTVDMAARIAQHQREAFLAQLRDRATWMEQDFRRNNPQLVGEDLTTRIDIRYDPAHPERATITITVVPKDQRLLDTGRTRSLLGDNSADAGGGSNLISTLASPLEATETKPVEEISFIPTISAWQAFELGGSLTVAALLPIYQGWDPMAAPLGSSGRSLSSAGTSLSSAGTSLSSSGTSFSAIGTSFSSAGTSPSSVMITPSSAPSGYHVDWGAYFSPTDPFRVGSTRLSDGQRTRGYGYGDEPALCGR